MKNSNATVSAKLGVTLMDPQHGAIPLVASLYYSTQDPYAIRMAFHIGAEEPVEWTFARSLLAVGLEGPAGEGDLQVWPADERGNQVLNIGLSSRFGEARLGAPRGATACFLNRTYEVIPPGHEDQFVDVDSELDELLRRG